MTPLAARVLRTLQVRGLVRLGDRVAVALSGGPDSVALVHVLTELAAPLSIEIAGCVHLNHRLRPEADDDERFCADVARSLGLTCVSEQVDVAVRARQMRVSLEAAGRAERRAFFTRAADHLGAGLVAVGHTRSDQAETVLLRLVRGTGTRGLGGIQPRLGRVIRPLIDVPREAVAQYLSEQGLASREDASNRDLRFVRNRVRHVLLPLLRDEFSPRVEEALARVADLCREDALWLDSHATETAREVVLTTGEGLAIELEALTALPLAIRRRVLSGVAGRFAGRRAVEFAHIERLLDLAAGPSGRVAQLPGLTAVRSARRLHFKGRQGRFGSPAARAGSMDRQPLPVPGEVMLDKAGVAVEAVMSVDPEAEALRARGSSVTISAVGVKLPLAVRGWRPGDRLQPLGTSGRKKVQDVFVDCKVPRERRADWPLVVDADDRIVWVGGHVVAEDFRVSDPRKGVIILRVRQLGGVA